MTKIAICDDTLVQLEINKFFMESFLEEKHIDADIHTFSHPEELLTALDNERYDIYLLDMIMPLMNGVELGKIIRSNDKNAIIIFLTVDKDYALEAYSVNPLHYLLKPIGKTSFFEALELAFSKLPEEDNDITIRTKNGVKSIPIDSIICAEYNNHKVIFKLRGGEICESKTITGKFLEYVAPLINSDSFISPHESFVLNLKRVESFDKKGFIMKDGTFVPVSGRQYQEVKNIYQNYIEK